MILAEKLKHMIIFHKGAVTNQGNIYTFKEEDFIDACEKAIKRFESNKINENGLKLQEEYTSDNTLSQILKLMD